jgi:hypothetical protein
MQSSADVRALSGILLSFIRSVGFAAGFDANLSNLLFSTYLGDGRPFAAMSAAPDGDGNVLIAGSTLNTGDGVPSGSGALYPSGNLVVANRIALKPSPTLRLGSVENHASHIAAPLAPGEVIIAAGAGFRTGAQIMVDGSALPSISGTDKSIVAVVPGDVATAGAHAVQISNNGAVSNAVFVPAAATSPAIFTVDCSGEGQGYILNSDGTLNSPANPAPVGSAITQSSIQVRLGDPNAPKGEPERGCHHRRESVRASPLASRGNGPHGRLAILVRGRHMGMTNLFDVTVANQVKTRLEKLQPQTERRWGRMTAAQMLAHCSVSMQWAVGEVVPEKGALPARLVGRLIKRLVFRNDDPLRRNSPTAKSLIVADERDLPKEREQLSGLISKFAAQGAAGCTKNPHSFFGKMTPEQWAILMYKHLDHHLRQFGV